jgi:peroxiredoxin
MKLHLIIYSLIITPLLSFAQPSPKGLQLNDKAPDFSAKDQHSKLITLSAELKKGAVVMVFYRGQWCPYCNRQLKGLQDSLSFIKEKGAILIAVSPEKPENISKTVEKTKASYSVLFDDGLKIMKSYDVIYNVDSSTVEKYKKNGIDFYDVNGGNGATLPVPTVYIINKEGIIVFKHFDPDYRKRVTVQEILSHL